MAIRKKTNGKRLSCVEQGRLKAQYTIEGMHIKPEGYRAIFEDIMAYVIE